MVTWLSLQPAGTLSSISLIYIANRRRLALAYALCEVNWRPPTKRLKRSEQEQHKMSALRPVRRYLAQHGDECILVLATSEFNAQRVARSKFMTPPTHTWRIRITGPVTKHSPELRMVTRWTPKS